MTEISSCEPTVREGQRVKRGEELGMFHFGGSSSLLLFNKESGFQPYDSFIPTAEHRDIDVYINQTVGKVNVSTTRALLEGLAHDRHRNVF